MSTEALALATGALLCWVALVHITLAVGVRRGELVWSGKRPRLLDSGLRLRSALSALLLVVSGWVLAEATELIGADLIPERFTESATFAVTAFLTGYFIYTVFWGTRWERMLFAPITLGGAALAAWLTFA